MIDPSQSDSGIADLTQPQSIRIESIAQDQRKRWMHGERVLVERYLGTEIDVDDHESILDMICYEFLLLEEYGESPKREDYLSRFPYLESELIELLEVHHACAFGKSGAGTERGTDASTLANASNYIPNDIPTAAPDRPLTSNSGFPFVEGYRIDEEIGRGGMGVVFKAWHAATQRFVALKIIRNGHLASPDEIRRFLDESAAAARLDHPAIVPIFDVGQTNGQHYFTMGLIDGQSLSRKLQQGPIAPTEAAQLVKQIAEGIAYAHGRGVAHRDLKPQNVLLDSQDQVRVVDFGLAKSTDAQHTMTRTGQLLGTPQYLSPEQTAGDHTKVGNSTDIYAIGTLLYECLTGTPPFVSVSMLGLLRKISTEDPVSPRRHVQKIPRDLETICLKCLQKNPGQRYASADLLAEDLRCFLAGKPVKARPLGVVESFFSWYRRQPLVATLLTTVVLLCLVVAAGAILTSFTLVRKNQDIVQSERAAHDAKLDAERRLAESRLEQARALRLGSQAGRAVDAWSAIEESSRLFRQTQMTATEKYNLRNEAIAGLKLLDAKALFSVAIDRQPIRPWSLEVASKGRQLAYVASNNSLCTGRFDGKLNNLSTNGMSIQALAFAGVEQDRLFAVARTADDTSVYEFDEATNQLRPTFEHIASPIRAMCTAEDGSCVGLIAGSEVHVVDLQTGNSELFSIELNNEATSIHCVLDRSADRIAIWQRNEVHIYDVNSGEKRHTLIHRPTCQVQSVAFANQRNHVVTGGSMHSAYVWSLNEPAQPLQQLNGHQGWVKRVSYSPDGRWIMTTGADHSTRLWHASSCNFEFQYRGCGLGWQNETEGFYSFDGASICHYDLRTPRTVYELEHKGQVAIGERICTAPANRNIFTTDWDGITVWDVPTHEVVCKIAMPNVTAMFPHETGDCLFVADGQAVYKFSLNRLVTRMTVGDAVQKLPLPKGNCGCSLWVSHDESHFVIRGGTYVARENRLDKTCLTDSGFYKPTCEDRNGLWHVVAYQSGGKQGLRVFNFRESIVSGSPDIEAEIPFANYVVPERFTNDGSLLVARTDNSLALISTAKWKIERSIPIPEYPASESRSVDVNIANRLITLSEPQSHMLLLDFTSGKPIARLPTEYPNSTHDLSPNGNIIYFTGRDSSAAFWNLQELRNSLSQLELDW